MRTRLHGQLATLVILAAFVAALRAAAPIFWQVSTRAEFLKGEVDNLSVDSDGRLALGPATSTLFDASAPFLWTLVLGADGALFAGSGNDGRVFRIAADGKGSTFYDAPETQVHALAPAPDGALFVGHVARRPHLQGRRDRNGDAVLRSRRQVHLVAGRRRAGESLRRHRREGRHLQDRAGRPGQAVLHHQVDQRRVAGLHRRR